MFAKITFASLVAVGLSLAAAAPAGVGRELPRSASLQAVRGRSAGRAGGRVGRAVTMPGDPANAAPARTSGA